MDAIKHAKETSTGALVIGGGYIGMECAAAVANNGVPTTLVFPETHMMSRLFTPEMATFYEDIYRQR